MMHWLRTTGMMMAIITIAGCSATAWRSVANGFVAVGNGHQPYNKSYTDGSSGHWIKDNIDSGGIILLEDGSLWKIDPIDKIDTALWLPISNIMIVTSEDGSPGYDFLLINTDDGEKAHAKYIGSK